MKDNIQEKYKNYSFRIGWTGSEPFDPENETVEVRLITINNQEYYANFTAKNFIDYMFEKNKRTGECAAGAYFCMPDMIIVEKINNPAIKATIDDLIKNLEIEKYFKKLD